MTIVRPFRAHRYDARRVDLTNVLAPPYDVIAADERGTLYERDPHNAVRLELTRERDDEAATDYSEIATTLSAWCESGVLLRDEEPAFYLLRQRFRSPDGELLQRDGFFAELQLEEYSERIVRPHERTMAAPVADRLKLLRATKANLSSVFMLYEDRQKELTPILSSGLDAAPIATARDDAEVEYSLAALTDRAAIQTLQRFLERRSVVIADGHHRYETALAYRDECRAKAHSEHAGAWESTLVYLTNAYAPGNLLLPIHRVILKRALPTLPAWAESLSDWQQRVIPLVDGTSIDETLKAHLTPLEGQPAFAADDGSGVLRLFYRTELLGEDLMVERLEFELMKRVLGLDAAQIRDGAVSFPKSAERAAREVRSGEGILALYLNPLSAEDVFRVTEAGELMPQKSTFFHPKIPTGLVFRTHQGAA